MARKSGIGFAIGLCLALFSGSQQGHAQDRAFDLAAPQTLVDTGFLRFLLPRFSLKHSTRVNLVDAGADAAARLITDPAGGANPVFSGGGVRYYLAIATEDSNATRFADWLRSEVGQNTVATFADPNQPAFAGIAGDLTVDDRPVLTGNAARGLAISLAKCGRCHVIDAATRLKGIGSTPSFFVLRGLPEWENRFAAFYVLKPHPSFTQVAEITAPFSSERPPPIFPISTTLDEIDDILAYVAGLTPADLGAPLQHQ